MHRMRGFPITDPVDGSRHLSDELVNYMNFCLTGEPLALKIPAAGGYLDTILNLRPFDTGDMLLFGDRYIACVEVSGWPEESFPQILDALNHLEFPYRWSTRFIFLDAHEAVREIKKLHRKWKQKVRGFLAQMFKTQGGVINEDALLMTQQAQHSMALAEARQVAFGYHTCVVVLMDADPLRLLDNARQVARAIRHAQFAAEVTTINTTEAWLGSLPGHSIPNVVRPLQHTDTLAHVMPSSSVWAGSPVHPNPMYPPNAPPLLIAKTTGSTPFRISLHSSDTGHTLVFGPTGSGKSTLLATIIAQARRYQGATVFAIEKGKTLSTIIRACRGLYYDIGGDASPAFCPLGVLDSEEDLAWAEDWISICYELHHQHSAEEVRDEIHRALLLLQGSPSRTITHFAALVQDEAVRQALRPYAITGAMGRLFDGESDGMEACDLIGCDIGALMNMREPASIPLLLYLFRRFERSLHGQPAFLIIDEAWLLFRNPLARPKIVELLKGMRKLCCSVIMATQSLSDAARSELLDVLLESCPTVIYGANPQAEVTGTETHPGPRDFYAALGRNENEISIIMNMIPKRHYYLVSPEGRRLFELGLGPTALAFVGVGSSEEIAEVEALERRYGDDWPLVRLQQKGLVHDHTLRQAAE
jgi:type IV secretion system protein VirB4